MARNSTKITAEPGKQEIFITREFDAPRDLVFKAFVDPKLIVQWLLGPRKHGLTMTLDKFEPRTGGVYRFIHRDQQGNEYAFHGSIHEVLTPERIVQTFEFEGLPEKGHVSLETARFEELPGGRTKLITQSVFQSVADRDGMLQSGMEEGVNDSYDRLDELLAKPQVPSPIREAGITRFPTFLSGKLRQAWKDGRGATRIQTGSESRRPHISFTRPYLAYST